VVRVLLADDHQVVREGVRALLDRHGFAVIAEADDGEQAAQLARRCRPDVSIVDLSMPRRNGVECTRDILADDPNAAVMMLTVSADEHDVVAALRAGVRGYVVKTQAAAELVRAIHEVHRGGIYLSARASSVIASAYLDGDGNGWTPLPPRQRDILRLIADGQTTRQIAGALGISPKTVELHRGRLMAKLDIHDTAGLVRYALRSGLATL
jgi:DNA-binding NarL/FixJ family response regulator